MSDPLTMVVGIGIVSFLLLTLLSYLDDRHEVLKYLIVMSVLAMMLIMPKVFGESMKTCDTVVSNSTVTGNTTAYSYTSYCTAQDSSTTSTFMSIVYWTYYLIIGYLLMWIFVKALGALWDMRGGRP